MKNIFKDKKVLITGHSGFKGIWLSLLLNELGAKVSGYSLAPRQNPIFDACASAIFQYSFYEDIRNKNQLRAAIAQVQPEIIFHLAAQPLVIDSYEDPLYTFEVNAMGTANLLDVVRECGNECSVIVVTTDKVYENHEYGIPYREEDALGGHDPYSSSKACAELIVQSFRKSYFSANDTNAPGIALASARAGNVIGGGDWSPNRIFPDIVRAFSRSDVLQVRNPSAVRPWQHVLDALAGYLSLAEKLVTEHKKLSWQSAWNFGPEAEDSLSVETIVKLSANCWGNGKYELAVPDAKTLHEAGLLRLDCSKAMEQLNWKPLWHAKQAIEETLEWYKKALIEKEDPAEVTLKQIRKYLSSAHQR